MKSGKVLEVLKITKPTLLKKIVDYNLNVEKTPSGENIFRWKHITKLRFMSEYGNKQIKTFILSVCQNKGGVGKTTAAINIATLLSFIGKVLIIDLDSQANLSQFYNIYLRENMPSVAEFLNHPDSFDEVKINVAENIDLLPNNLKFERWKNDAKERGFNNYGLRKALKDIKEKYQFIIIDTPPALDLSLQMALFASDYCIIPFEPHPFSLEGITNIIEEIKYISSKDDTGTINLEILGIFVNMYEKNNLSLQISDYISEKQNVFESKIKKMVAVQQSQALKKSIFEYDETSAVTHDYFNLTFEILERVLR